MAQLATTESETEPFPAPTPADYSANLELIESLGDLDESLS